MNILEKVKFNADGLIPAIAQDVRTDEVLMLAYMNEESLRKTIETGKVHYYSRSRRKLWMKGETSGHFQNVKSIGIDCDGDALLIKVEQTGAACHTGHRSCFFTRLDADELRNGLNLKQEDQATGAIHEQDEKARFAGISGEDTEVRPAGAFGEEAETQFVGISGEEAETQPERTAGTGAGDGHCEAGPEVLGEVFDIISDRRIHPKEGSYTNYLFAKGLDKILKKIGEEACEVVIASKNGSKREISAEVADLIYHIMVLLAEKNMTLNDVYEELNNRK